ncbi:fatty acid desaturase family protein [Pseudobacteriovorax antillogorgiicola]|uniref:Fatty acid desaturase n=1 Tax=Pseudobacteriovorax antillogorgiicola TaxID=1513793 RepID=A0A1Y6CJU3_9BACT|nr:fatty acid desaturase [Pseudobacteriovorax antillogorgiicola]TCS47672.1 fatty acid desaturase [Pseudobacteriovorax antillogorgiicola]SMF59626.1 Fatty acid desaturase [Pseudobacteriovorax antillogorgiicola]
MVWLKQKPSQNLRTRFEERFSDIDLDGFTKELQKLEDKIRADFGADDRKHLKKIIRWGRLSSFAGYATGMLIPNPVSAYLISQGKFTRWTTIAHHVLHKAYDKSEDIGPHNSKTFAKGWRRFFDWLDWIDPAAWEKEHNVLHHYRLGERFDPDVFEDNVLPARMIKAPRWLKVSILSIIASQWKWSYYAPSTIKQLFSPKKKDGADSYFDRLQFGDRTFWPWTKEGWALMRLSYIPYVVINFGLVPAGFLVFGIPAAVNIFLTLVMAEIITNLHTFATIVPNHTGSDLYRFEGAPKDRQEFFIRQIVGSVNYKCGGDLNDFLHGWLNYQIEHHVWPDMTLLQYQKAQPELKALCEKYGVPYIQESVWTRLKKLISIFTGEESMMAMEGKQVRTAPMGTAS